MAIATTPVTLKIQRFNPDTDKEPYWREYTIQAKPGMTVLEALFEVLNKYDGTLSFRFCCRGAICGACSMMIGGKIRLACETQVSAIKKRPLMISPMPHKKVIKDLVVDMDPFFEQMRSIKPYLVAKEPFPEKEIYQSEKDRAKLTEPIDCILCGSCSSACTVAWWDPNYIGPASLTKAYRFVVDSRDTIRDERLDMVDSEDGVWRCHTIFNCVDVCPKKINQTDAIQYLKRQLVKRKIGLL
ncbi:MAG: succinate dehydrogenase iron-sulfur subunit [Thermoplasmata archaeon]|nr:succinate dehydrogenase iron-sulfur subunit [Thermoplasmata archaeon]